MTYTDTDIAQINHDLEAADPKSILKFAYESFGDNLAVVTSFQPTGIVTLHMLHELEASVSVLTLDTGMLFPETYALIDQVEQLFDLRLKRVRPELTIERQEAHHGAVARADDLFDAEILGELRMRFEMASLAVHRHGDAGADRIARHRR